MFHDLKHLIANAVQRAGVSRQVEAASVVELFNRLAREAKAVYVRNNILTVECGSSLIMQELRYREPEIIQAINQQAGGRAVEKIRFMS